MTPPSNSSEIAGRFVDAFADAWARPTPERLTALLHPEVRLAAPLTRTTTGIAAAAAEFARVLALLPDLRGEVHRWSGTDQLVFIEFTLSATAGRGSVSWRAVDRFRLDGNLAVERVSYFDPLPLVVALLRHPSLWPRAWQWKLGRR